MINFVSIRTQYENLGDEVIGAALVTELASRQPVVALAAGVPNWYLSQFRQELGRACANITLCRSATLFAFQLLKAMIRYEKVTIWLSPGDIPHDIPAISRTGLRMLLSACPRLRVSQVGASYAKVAPSQFKLLQAAQRAGSNVAVRDARSQDVLRRSGLTVPVIPDLAFLLNHRSGGARRRAVLSFRCSHSQEYDKLLARLRPCVPALLTAGIEPVVSFQVGRDREPMGRLADDLHLSFVDWPGFRPSKSQVQDLYCESAMVLSNRLHALLVAASCGAVPFAVLTELDMKIAGVFEGARWHPLMSTAPGADASAVSGVLAELPIWQERLLTDMEQAATAIADFFDAISGSRPTPQLKAAAPDGI